MDLLDFVVAPGFLGRVKSVGDAERNVESCKRLAKTRRSYALVTFAHEYVQGPFFENDLKASVLDEIFRLTVELTLLSKLL